jgi:hypothetical protein
LTSTRRSAELFPTTQTSHLSLYCREAPPPWGSLTVLTRRNWSGFAGGNCGNRGYG